jgi:hypothetical protein
MQTRAGQSIFLIGCLAASASTVALSAFGQDKAASVPECSYSNIATNKYVDGPCLMRTIQIGGNYALTLTFADGTRVQVEYLESQSGNHRWKINGQPGMGFELNRYHLRGAALDLKQIVEWNTSPSPRR